MTEQDITNDYIFVWLDKTIEISKDNQDVKALIQLNTRSRLRIYIEPDICIENLTGNQFLNKRIILIISNEFGPVVLPVIHDCPHIQSIYVYCTNRSLAQEWSKTFMKVTNIFTDRNALLTKICEHVCTWDIDRQLPISIFHLEDRQNSLQNLTSNSATFMWYQTMILVLRSMAKYSDSKRDMIDECLASYHDDETEKKRIKEFEQDYLSSGALKWYTRDSFVYRLLNRALRTQKSEIIFKFRFFINDLHDQLVNLYHQYLTNLLPNQNQELIVYRGQHMNLKEVTMLEQNVNQMISMNSFLSATTDKELAKVFAGVSDEMIDISSIQSVLFIIKISDMTKDTIPFAFIQNYSCCPSEEEILFSIGAIFEVISVEQHEKIWHVNLQLSKQQNIICQELSSYMIRQIGTNPSPLSFGWFLYRMNDFNGAKRHVQYLLQQFSTNNRIVGDIYTLLGLIHEASRNLLLSIENYNKALSVYKSFNVQSSALLINAHTNLGLALIAKGDYQKADEQRKLAEDKLHSSFNKPDRKLMIRTYTLKGRVQREYGNHQNALQTFNRVLKDKEEELPEDHPSIATTLMDLGIVYERMDNNSRAMDYFNRAFTIFKKTLAPDHTDHAKCLINMARINTKLENSKLASQQYQIASNIQRNSIREDFD
ncbi:hypothetical protein I4U23_025259 [Adineta vaga]|nr:hypothetical protein I4U23_025259 [Adineta vaga]